MKATLILVSVTFALFIRYAPTAPAAEGSRHFGCLAVFWRAAPHQPMVGVTVTLNGVGVATRVFSPLAPTHIFRGGLGPNSVSGSLEALFTPDGRHGKLEANMMSWRCGGGRRSFAGELGRW